jgi:hypothetical protein
MFHIEADVTWRFATVFAHSWTEFQKTSLDQFDHPGTYGI